MEIPAKMVSDLRAKTGAGINDCKKALQDASGDFEAAIEILRKKGVATADKKAGRHAGQGLVHSYIHLGGKVGVLVEINCETDFVAKNEEFKQLCADICMHIAALSPIYLSCEEVPADIIAKEREIAAAQAAGKPAQAIEKIVEGKLNAYYKDVCLLEQPFVKNQDVSVKDYLTQFIAKMGENTVIRRFARFQVGA